MQASRSPSEVVQKFVEEWPSLMSDYKMLAQEAKRQCEIALDEETSTYPVKCLITARAKPLKSILKSILRREDARKKRPSKATGELEGGFENRWQIIEEMPDLAGIRIILVFPDDITKVHKFITTEMHESRPPSFWGVDQEGNLKTEHFRNPKNRFVGYRASHYRVRLKKVIDDGKRSKEERISCMGNDVEIQVTSMTMYAWQEVHHDLIYKPYAGELTDDEKHTLDMVNGLVHANEIALNTFHRSLNRRLDENRTKFRDKVHLSSWLTKVSIEVFNRIYTDMSPEMQWLDALLAVVRFYELDTAEKLAEVVGATTDNPMDEALDVIRVWTQQHEEGLRNMERNADISAWALFRVCQSKSPFRSMEGQYPSVTKKYIVITQMIMAGPYYKESPFGKQCSQKYESLLPRNVPSTCILGQVMQSYGQKPVDHKEFIEQEDDQYESSFRSLMLEMRKATGRGLWSTSSGIGLAMSLLNVSVVPVMAWPGWDRPGDDQVIWPGVINVQATEDYYRELAEDDFRNEIITKSFLLIQNGRWIKYSLSGRREAEVEWEYVKHNVADLKWPDWALTQEWLKDKPYEKALLLIST